MYPAHLKTRGMARSAALCVSVVRDEFSFSPNKHSADSFRIVNRGNPTITLAWRAPVIFTRKQRTSHPRRRPAPRNPRSIATILTITISLDFRNTGTRNACPFGNSSMIFRRASVSKSVSESSLSPALSRFATHRQQGHGKQENATRKQATPRHGRRALSSVGAFQPTRPHTWREDLGKTRMRPTHATVKTPTPRE